MLPLIFLGPSLSIEKAKQIFPFADYRPPARKGDLQKLAKQDVRFVGFVDGVFLQDYPPTPIEVYTLLQTKSITLVGAASLGALRAVEMEKFGMLGIGRIFELYKRGVIHSDDEVAVTFSDEDHRLLSEAMIDIRYTLHHAWKDRVINRETKRTLTKIAKSIYFPNRNYEEMFERAMGSVDGNTLENLRCYVTKYRRSLKEEDAVKLVQFIKERYLETLGQSSE